VHALTPEGNSEGLPAEAEVQPGAGDSQPLPLASGQAVARFGGQAVEVRIALPDRPPAH
jgi:hypothetical protein